MDSLATYARVFFCMPLLVGRYRSSVGFWDRKLQRIRYGAALSWMNVHASSVKQGN